MSSLKIISDLYKNSSDRDVPLLSNLHVDFWNDYITNYKEYDRLFSRMYMSFVYAYQTKDESVGTVRDNFAHDVKTWLLINSKKYSELYREEVLDNYEFDNNFILTETYTGRADSNNRHLEGIRTDTVVDAIGSRTDTSSDSIGEREDSVTATLGERTDTNSNAYGAVTQNGISKTSPYDSDEFHNSQSVNNTTNARTDTASTVTGEQSNSTVTSIGGQSNSSSITLGEQENTTTTTKGAQENSDTIAKNDSYTLSKKGTAGRYDKTSLIRAHNNYWTSYEFYLKIFKEISKEFLLVDISD